MILSVRFVASERDVPVDLWAACFPPPLEGRWWFRAMEQGGLDDQFAFFYAVLEEDGGRPVGVAPAFMMNLGIEMMVPEGLLPIARLAGKLAPSLLFQRTLFVGSPCSDEGVVGLLPGVDRDAALDALHVAFDAESRRRKASMLVWKDFPRHWDEAFAGLKGRHRLFSMHSFPGTVAVLGDKGRDSYYAGLKSSRRYTMQRKLKRSRQLVELTVEAVQYPDSAVLDEVFALFWQTYERASTRFETLTRVFFDRLAELDLSHFILLREASSGKLVAFMLCFVQGDHVINKFIGLDYGRPRDWSLYFRLWDAVVDWAGGLGATVIQSGQTGYRAKIEMGHRLVPMSNHSRHRNPLIHWIYATVASGVNWQTLDKDLALYLKAHPDEIPA
ncbi:MAG TPA: GNAT family N-acetyltransferase [Candidatus Sulfotelmatobacter sp.]|jgi:hypothetical protein|nr:GNAT family N-acetyltransferase [Candidatus Sulfotelmatobacter sp.]